MKRLVLYSDQVPGKSDKVDNKLMELIGKENPTIAYIPSAADTNRKYFNQKVLYYGRLGIHNLMYFDLDVEYQPALLERLLACDAIHLSGGETSYFLSSLKKRGFISILRNYALTGGVLIGISAGSILMSKNIDAAGLLQDEDNELRFSESLNLVDFDFVPHWERNHVYIDNLKQYSRQNAARIYCCTDSDGIVVKGDEVSFIGQVIEIKIGTLRLT